MIKKCFEKELKATRKPGELWIKTKRLGENMLLWKENTHKQELNFCTVQLK